MMKRPEGISTRPQLERECERRLHRKEIWILVIESMEKFFFQRYLVRQLDNYVLMMMCLKLEKSESVVD